MSDLILELFSEEIPARMQRAALAHLQEALAGALRKEGFAVDAAQVVGFVTPRRLAVLISGLDESQPSTETELKGPRVGAPEAAVNGFLAKNGLKQSDLTEQGGVYFAVVKKQGAKTAELLKPLIEQILAQFPWPKSMRWGAHETRWVRPLHAILCLFGSEVVPVQFDPVTAGGFTFGHRFLHPDAITLHTPAHYRDSLRNAFVLADMGERRERIRQESQQLAASKGLRVRDDEALLDEVTGLVEWPIPLLGSIDPEYMALPQEVLVTVMRSHQKYFALEDAQGNLAPYFLTVANRFTTDDGREIVAGNERVLRARLADGRFFWEQDLKRPLDQWAEGLANVTYHAKLGTVADKVERVRLLASELAQYVPGANKASVDRAAQLAKADLVTGMVGEFAELQGIMGRYYALAQNEKPEVADALRDQYAHAKDELPTAPTSVCLALADRLDTLKEMFRIGEKPTGSKDPFALRRAAIAVIQLMLKNNLRLKLGAFLPSPSQPIPPASGGTSLEGVLHFLADRLQVILREEGISPDRIRAVMAHGEDDLVRLSAKARALHGFLTSPEGVDLLAAYKRASNILKAEEKKDGIVYSASEVDNRLLQLDAEKRLATLLLRLPGTLEPLERSEDFTGMMRELSALRAPLDGFFTDVLVNDPDPSIRANRLRLLASIRESIDSVADFSLIEG